MSDAERLRRTFNNTVNQRLVEDGEQPIAPELLFAAIVEEFGLTRDDPYLRQHKQAHDLVHAIIDVAEA